MEQSASPEGNMLGQSINSSPVWKPYSPLPYSKQLSTDRYHEPEKYSERTFKIHLNTVEAGYYNRG
jgi:hypothetical protein